MIKHFVEFYSPGTFTAEITEKPIEEWDVKEAIKLSKNIVERYGAKPYGFRFLTRQRGDNDLDSKISNRSGIYYLGGRLRTLAEVEADNLPDEEILRSNMRRNKINCIIENTNSWKFHGEFKDGDIILKIDDE